MDEVPGKPSVNSTRIDLHIGMPKSGSSALQAMLEAERDSLQSIGVIVPRTGLYQGAHYQLVRELREERPWRLWTEALSELQNAKQGVVSAEGLWFATESQVERLAQLVASFDVRVHAYVRKPSPFLCSFYRQRIKGSGRAESMSQFLAQEEACVDYPKILSRWSKRFPIRVRTYEAVRAHIVDDFLQALDVALEPRRLAELLNRTPSDGAHRAMWWANRVLPTWLAGPCRSLIEWSDSLFSGCGAIPDQVLRRVGDAVLESWGDAEREAMGILHSDWQCWKPS